MEDEQEESFQDESGSNSVSASKSVSAVNKQ
jgi:hypothetical protein